MAQLLVKGVHRVTKTLKSGETVQYHYAWRGGPRFWASTTGISKNGPDYWAAYRDALEDRNPSKGLFREIITAYLKSREFQRLKPRTRKDYSRSIHHATGIDAKFGAAPTAAFNNPKIRRVVYAWRDSFASPRVADHYRTHLNTIVNWGVDKNYLSVNHLAGMSSLYQVDRSDIIWTDAEIETFTASAPSYLARALIAATETGLRPGDLIRLSRTHIQRTTSGRRIYMRTEKRQRFVSIPLTDKMAEIVDATPSDRLLILVGQKGNPYQKASSIGRLVGKHRDRIGLRSDLRLYDARGTAATRLFEANASLREIATHMGWSVAHAAKMIETYVAMNPDASDALLLKLN